jgi:hypothetical protein
MRWVNCIVVLHNDARYVAILYSGLFFQFTVGRAAWWLLYYFTIWCAGVPVCEFPFCDFIYYTIAGVNAVSTIFLLFVRDIFRQFLCSL